MNYFDSLHLMGYPVLLRLSLLAKVVNIALSKEVAAED